jgi:ABC-type polysaccharide/polyol phosphate transport system ATPase subunit
MSEAMTRLVSVPPESAPQKGPLIVRADKLGKAFRRFDRQPFLLRNLLLKLAGKAKPPREFWPLRNVSFEIRRGETVGVIGTNGSGKSTLLRLIAGACFPSEGHLAVRGRIAPLLSLGTGFHPDMTGRECVEVNATTLGLTPQEIRDRMDVIVGFADIGDFMETPLRYYSSGMIARLGFAVAVHTEPDLLLVDEVLSVGDHEFQAKCRDRMFKIQEAGTTILLVSHDHELVTKLCNRALWIRDGGLVADGDPKTVVDQYLGYHK